MTQITLPTLPTPDELLLALTLILVGPRHSADLLEKLCATSPGAWSVDSPVPHPQPENALRAALEAQDYPAAARWLLERCDGPGVVGKALHALLLECSARLRAKFPERFDAIETHPQHRLESAFAQIKAEWLEREYPSGFGGIPELAGLRLELIAKGVQGGGIGRECDFSEVEARVERALQAGDLGGLRGALQPDNRYSRSYFEHRTGRRLPKTARDLKSVLREILGESAVARFEAGEEQKRLERAILEKSSRLRALERTLGGRRMLHYGSVLAFGQFLLAEGYLLRSRQQGAVVVKDALAADRQSYFPRIDPDLRAWLELSGMALA